MENSTAINQEKVSPESLRGAYTETEQVLFRRRSVRAYKKEQVPDWMVKRVLEAGRFAPSAGNCQPWKFVVLRDKEMIDELQADVQKLSALTAKLIDYRDNGSWLKRSLANLLIRFQPSMMHPTPFGAVRYLADGKLGLYHGASTVILIFKDTRGISNPDLDCGIVGQNMVISAHSMGLGTCWVGFTKLAFDYMGKWKKRLGIDYPYKFASSVGVGYPLGKPDGMIPRPLHPVEWFEGGEQKTLWDQGATRILPKSERKRIPDYSDKSQIVPGVVEVEGEKCTACGLCLKACPANAMEIVDKVSRMRPAEEQECVMCGACIAICPTDAVTPVEQAHFAGRFMEIDRGDMVPPRLFDDE
jgi:nitroreductase/ferredoxin